MRLMLYSTYLYKFNGKLKAKNYHINNDDF